MQKSLKISNLEIIVPPIFSSYDSQGQSSKAYQNLHVRLFTIPRDLELLLPNSNNSKPQFSDQEILTIFLFVGSEQRYTRIKEIHSFAKEYLLDWFPGLVSYQTFVYRLNRMVGAVGELLKHLIVSYKPDD